MARAAAEDDAFLYERIADELDDLIGRGALRAGDRLPSVRRLSEERGVSVATVVAAYLLLEGRGVAEARPKSGHFVRARSSAEAKVPSVPRRTAAPARVSIDADADQLIQAMLQARHGEVPLGCAYLAPELLPLRKLNTMLAQVAREGGGPGGAYDELRGSLQLRRQLARLAAGWGVALGEDELVTTLGGTDALNLAIGALTRPGDVIALESPAYFAFLRMFDHHGLRAIEIPTDPRTGLDLDALADALRRAPVRAVLCSPNFQNPLGARMPDEHKERLVRMVSRRGIALIEDDVYGDLAHDGSRPRPAKAFDRDGSVLLVGSMSKTLAPGYRVGWLAPGRFDEPVLRRKSAMTLACPTPTEMAVAELLEHGGYERHLRRLRRALADQSAQHRDAIVRAFPEGTRVSQPQGGFVLWVEMPHGISGIELQARALEQGIAIAPGPIFSARARFQSCIRISSGHPFSPRIHRAIATLGRLAHES
ncbi:PLP-dependent aminotransferase family protein [Sandaracinus amylolyticus]|uniref:Transcriptional regulator, GntR family protein n=1 Tax=Sandaracinus amylolyticus TaxID=927083 RepID=A0A0F6YLM3_9BACT|nr:PLP-dependent aminotransferase family protein [Sandaracinus amylolyticus]AKF09353.1 Transcriptional regulator, GntR family protein [Sandaracinus amylolyticus]